MRVPLEGKTILITGASSGIGEATARACISAGMRCVITARREDRLKKLCGELGDSCSYIAGNVTEEGFNQHLLDESGEVYAIFANAGHGLDQKMVDSRMEQFEELFTLNVFSAVELASLATKEMIKRKSGHIILNASCLSKFSVPHNGAYCGSKSALESIAKSMRMELKKSNVFVSTVHPVGTKTEFFKESSSRSETEFSDFEKNYPAWLMQPPEKVAKAVVKCLRKPKPEIWTNTPMRLISTLFTAFPRVGSIIITRFS